MSSSCPHAGLRSLIAEQAGVLTSAQILTVLGRGKLRSALARGQWRRLCSGIIVTHNGPLAWRQMLWAAILATGPGAVIAGRTAAHVAGLRLGEPGPIHILVTTGRGYSQKPVSFPADMPTVAIRRTVHLPSSQICSTSLPMTIPARSLADAASWAVSDTQARLLLFAGCQQGLARPDQIRRVVMGLSRTARRSLILQTLSDIAGGITTLSELDFALLCERFGLPQPDRQIRRKDSTGRLRYLDAYWRRWRLLVEIDGSHHMDAAQWERDMCRQNAIWLAGDRLLRFTSRQIRSEPAVVAAQLRTALRAAGWRESDLE